MQKWSIASGLCGSARVFEECAQETRHDERLKNVTTWDVVGIGDRYWQEFRTPGASVHSTDFKAVLSEFYTPMLLDWSSTAARKIHTLVG